MQIFGIFYLNFWQSLYLGQAANCSRIAPPGHGLDATSGQELDKAGTCSAGAGLRRCGAQIRRGGAQIQRPGCPGRDFPWCIRAPPLLVCAPSLCIPAPPLCVPTLVQSLSWGCYFRALESLSWEKGWSKKTKQKKNNMHMARSFILSMK